jgi:hypothetical protein
MRRLVIIAAISALILAGIILLRMKFERGPAKGMASEPAGHESGFRFGAEDRQASRSMKLAGSSNEKSRAWVPDESPSNLSAGGIEVAIAFESEVSPEMQKVIVHDLNLIHGHLESHEYVDSYGSPELLINGSLRQPDRFLKFTGRGRYFPSELTGRIGFMTGDTMILPRGVIEAYEHAWQRKTANEESYISLLGAIDRLNSLKKNLIDNPRDWFFLSRSALAAGIDIPDVSRERFAQDFGGYRYRQPSLLDVFDGANWDPDFAGKLVARVFVFDSDGVIRNSMPPLIHTDGSWRFLIGRPPA